MDKNLTPQELERRSQDRILVHNILQEDIVERWGGVPFVIPSASKDTGRGLGNAVLPRYIAENYVKHMCDRIMGANVIQAVKDRNLQLKAKGEKQMEKWIGGEEETYTMQLLADKNQQIEELIPQLWLKVDEEYGMAATLAPDRIEERKDPFDFINSILDRKGLSEPNAPRKETEEVIPEGQAEAAKESLIQEVSA